MIRGVHAMFYSSEPEALRAFLRDKLGFPATDVGGGWLIFDLPEADMGCHPAERATGRSGTHDISFYCDDIEKTVAELKARGVEFTAVSSTTATAWSRTSKCPAASPSSSTSRAIRSGKRNRLCVAILPCPPGPEPATASNGAPR